MLPHFKCLPSLLELSSVPCSMSDCSFQLFTVLFLCFSVVELRHRAAEHFAAWQWTAPASILCCC